MKTVQLSNLALIGIGILLVAIGLFRTYPPQMTKQFMWNNIPPVIALILVGVTLVKIGDPKMIQVGMETTLKTTSSFLIILITLMPLIGFGGVLTHYFEDSIAGALKGPLGYLWAILSAFGVPGGSAGSGAVTRIWTTQPELRLLLRYFMTITPLVSFTIFMIRRLGLTEEIAGAMYRTNWTIALALAPCFWIYGRFFSKM